MWTGEFWKATAERAVSTAAQAALLAIGADQLHVMDANWETIGGFAAGGAVLCVLKCLAAVAITGGSPSVTNAEVPASYDGRHRSDDLTY